MMLQLISFHKDPRIMQKFARKEEKKNLLNSATLQCMIEKDFS